MLGLGWTFSSLAARLDGSPTWTVQSPALRDAGFHVDNLDALARSLADATTWACRDAGDDLLVSGVHLKFWDLDDSDGRISNPIREISSELAAVGFTGTLCSEWGGHEWIDSLTPEQATRAHLALAREAGAETINYEEVDSVLDVLRDKTAGRGPDAVVDAVGMEAHGFGALARLDQVKTMLRLGTDRPTVLRMAIQACRKGGNVSIPGVYGGAVDKLNMGAAFSKGLTFKMGQTHVQRYLPDLLAHIEKGEIDPTFLITHRAPLSEAPQMYETFRNERDACVKVVLDPTA